MSRLALDMRNYSFPVNYAYINQPYFCGEYLQKKLRILQLYTRRLDSKFTW